MFLNPTIDDFKNYFTRDFPYNNSDPSLGVTDQDIAKAFGQTNVNFSQSLWSTQADYTIGYLFLSAHWLVMDLRMASQGLNGQYTWIETSKSVQGVAQGFQVPQRILDNPELAMLAKTNYGAKYLGLVLPQLSGQIFPVLGRTLP
jgi:hypothetical protein